MRKLCLFALLSLPLVASAQTVTGPAGVEAYAGATIGIVSTTWTGGLCTDQDGDFSILSVTVKVMGRANSMYWVASAYGKDCAEPATVFGNDYVILDENGVGFVSFYACNPRRGGLCLLQIPEFGWNVRTVMYSMKSNGLGGTAEKLVLDACVGTKDEWIPYIDRR